MLLIGLLSYLLRTMETELMMGHGVALNRAFLISTMEITSLWATIMVSVNALNRAFLISTGKEHEYFDLTYYGVNALNRAFLISTNPYAAEEISRNECQCPQSGFPHFYSKNSTLTVDNIGCQCPQSGFPHFYAKNVISFVGGGMCQCPQSGFPHFYGIPWETAIYKAFKTHFCK